MCLDFHIHSVGYRYQHEPGFLIDRPSGSGDYLFLHFLSNIEIKTEGQIISVPSDSCILYGPDFPQWYTSSYNPFINSFFHFRGMNVAHYMDQFHIPINQVFYPRNPSFIEIQIQSLEKEVLLKDTLWEYSVAGILMQFFVRLGRSCSGKNTGYTNPSKLELLEKFRTARIQILQHPEYPWTLERMASLTNLCVSRFSIYYKEFFHISPKADLISARVDRAKYMLTNEALSITEVSELVGYSNVFHFIRQFKSITGYSPGKWKNL